MLALAVSIALWLGLLADGGGATVMLDAPEARPMDLPEIVGAADPRRPLIVIDPGHGGSDPGAVAPDGTQEKSVTLAVAAAVREALAEGGRVRVALTRADDRRLGLRQRFEIARKLGASLFISIHADAAPNPQATGATVYSLSEVASDREAAELASRENAAELVGAQDAQGGSAVNRILIDLAQRESMAASAAFADLLVREAEGQVPLRPEPRKFASLIVLKAPDIPSILFEIGYMTNAQDAAFLGSGEGKARIAAAMRRAIEIHAARLMTGD
ncbi:N-acetylmuramoyl-L-alanine amidase [Allosphingosinicella flava]|uniref:N-acetylmuramoyl-L-alanine amidase n=1 Tax=Allosphingosinicella flava TaxID=2771430 RepID=A0A7T2GJG5_9SPHN|nr:N-acetylmuramoyl-L-alanine amidase [Sphingosinicella flava]QPQ55018.1 N-acetylmuramoyl-L-alanine amidase [Sphingosinicella flava]